jgi:hypothetical protein
MYYDYHDTIAKGREYVANAPHLMFLQKDGSVIFKGRHHSHRLQSEDGAWTCDCDASLRYQANLLAPFCAHIYAVEKVYPNGPPKHTLQGGVSCQSLILFPNPSLC